MKHVLLLGDNGMLGSMFRRVLSDEPLRLSTTCRTPSRPDQIRFDVESDDIYRLLADVGPVDAVINAIGVIKPRIDEASIESRLSAIRVNAAFPHHLAVAAKNNGAHVFQIATDCVYSGVEKLYSEKSLHDPTDVYGKTKSLGETPSDNVLHLRASIIGPEEGRSTSLWEWVRNQPFNATINGFLNHLWNGVTTFHFSKIVKGLITNEIFLSGVVHLVPEDVVPKADLVEFIAKASSREDISINRVDASNSVDRTLSTLEPERNRMLWSLAGYSAPPTIESMVLEVPLT